METLLLFSNVELNYYHVIQNKLFCFNILFRSLIEVRLNPYFESFILIYFAFTPVHKCNYLTQIYCFI